MRDPAERARSRSGNVRRLIFHCAALVAAASILTGCAAVKMRVAPRNVDEARALRPVARQLGEAAAWLTGSRDAKNREDSEKLSALLESARAAYPGAVRRVEKDAVIYRAALRRIAALEEKHDWELQPAQGARGARRLTIVRAGTGVLDPAAADSLVPADQVRIRGLRERSLRDGIGLPLVAWFRADSPFLRGEPGVPPSGIAIPATAVLTFDNGAAQLRFVRTLQQDSLVLDGRRHKLAADFSAPLAVLIAKGTNRTLDLVSLLFPLEHLHRMGLYQFQPYEPDKIPVVLVHGLMSRPETWRELVNELLDDPRIRHNYQFWFYLYPTGLPVWKSAAGLRSELDRFNAALAPRARTAGQHARLGRKVLVGHSMGGLLSSLQIRKGGDALWRQFSDRNFADVPMPAETRERIGQMIEFSPRRDISRVIFAAVPHRGSPVALHPSVSFAASLVRFQLPEIQEQRRLLMMKLREDVRRHFAVPANSIRFLRENSPFLLAILDLPRDRRIPVHSIIGDRGRNDAPRGGDGVVPYRSAHFPGAVSEKIVPSGHDAHEHSQGVAEIARILRESL